MKSTDGKTILAINSSGRKYGNSNILLREVIRPLEEAGCQVETINLATVDIRPCKGCGGCNNKDFLCTQKDELAQVKEKIAWADALVLAAPCYCLGAPSTFKTLLDRTAIWGLSSILEGHRTKYGVAVSVGGGAADWYSMQRAMPSLALRIFGCQVVGHLLVGNTSFRGEILLTPARLKQAQDLGQSLIQSLRQDQCISWESQTADENPIRTCPRCLSDQFQVSTDGTALTCTVCSTQQHRRRGLLGDKWSMSGVDRFTKAGVMQHMAHIGGKLAQSTNMGEEIKRRLASYKKDRTLPEVEWRQPQKQQTARITFEWQPDALEALHQAVPRPFLPFVKPAIEQKAISRGIYSIDKTLFQQMKREVGR